MLVTIYTSVSGRPDTLVRTGPSLKIVKIERNYIKVSGRPDTHDPVGRFIGNETTETNSAQVSGRPDTYEALTDPEITGHKKQERPGYLKNCGLASTCAV